MSSSAKAWIYNVSSERYVASYFVLKKKRSSLCKGVASPYAASYSGKFLCFRSYLQGGILLSSLQGNDKSQVRWRWKPVGHTASKCGLYELPAYLERTEQSSKNRLLWAVLLEFYLCCNLILHSVSVSNNIFLIMSSQKTWRYFLLIDPERLRGLRSYFESCLCQFIFRITWFDKISPSVLLWSYNT